MAQTPCFLASVSTFGAWLAWFRSVCVWFTSRGRAILLYTPELAALFAFLLFWGPFVFHWAKQIFFRWGPHSSLVKGSLEPRRFPGVLLWTGRGRGAIWPILWNRTRAGGKH